MERDELQFVICKNIEMEYLLKFGSVEYKIYEAECTALRLKRKCELIRAKKNRQETIAMDAIEERLDAEFTEYQEQLNQQIEKMNHALQRSKAEILSEADSRELKRLYRKIVKVLHPDLHPETAQTRLTLFDHAVSAYKNGDLETLKMIGELVADNPEPKQILEQYHEWIAIYRKKIEEMVR